MKSFLLIMFAFFSVHFAYTQTYDVYLVKADKLNLRTESSVKSESLGLLTKGDELLVLNEDNDWFHVEFGEYKGWVKKEFLFSKKENSYQKLNLQTGDSPECTNMNWKYDYEAKGSLSITVGRGLDFAVKLMDKSSDECIRAFYVRSGESINIKDIPEGLYYLKIASGMDYRQGVENERCIMVFNRYSSYRIGSDVLDFNLSPKRTKVENGEEYEVQDIPSYALSLDVPRGGKEQGKNLDSKKISEQDFNR